MRIGEILVESGLINTKQLDDALYYGKAKALPLGRCLKILRSITEENLGRALEAQKLIRGGLDSAVAVDLLRLACNRNVAFHEVLKQRALSSAGAEATGLMTAAAQLRNNSAQKYSMAVNFPSIPPLTAIGKDYRAPLDTMPEPQELNVDQLLSQGDQLLAEDRCTDAEDSYRRAREKSSTIHGVMHDKTAACIVKLANLYLSLDRFAEAEPLYQRALEIHTKLKGADHPLVAKSLEDLGDLSTVKSDYPTAERFFNESFAIVEAQQEPDVATIGRLLNKLSKTVRDADQSGSSSKCVDKKIGEYCIDAGLLTPERLQQALQRAKQTRSPLGSVLHSENFLSTQQLDAALFAQMLTKQAMVPYAVAVRALSVSGRVNVPLRHLAESGRLISDSLSKDEQYKQMVIEHERLINAETSLGAEHPDVAAIALRLADLLIAREDRHSAAVLLKRALAILEKSADTDKAVLAATANSLAALLIADNKLMEAQPLLLKALTLYQASGTSDSLSAADCLMRLGEVEAAQENFPSAVSFYRTAMSLYDKLNPGGCPHDVLPKITSCFMAAGLFAEAQAMQSRLITWAQTEFGAFEPETAGYVEGLGDLLRESGELKKAEAQYFFAMQIYERSMGSDKQVKALQSKLNALKSP